MGTATFSDGCTFSGDFVEDKKSGWGKEQEGEGEGWLIYLGDFVSDERHGIGMLRFSEADGQGWDEREFSDDDDDQGVDADEDIDKEVREIERLFSKPFEVSSALCQFGGVFRGSFVHGEPHGWGILTLGGVRGGGGRGPKHAERTLRGKFIAGRFLPFST
jgi:hypothetical protein